MKLLIFAALTVFASLITQGANAGVTGTRSTDVRGDVTIVQPRIFLRGHNLQINCNFGDTDTDLCRYAGLGKFVDRETGPMDVSETILVAYLTATKKGVVPNADSSNDWPIYDSITCRRGNSTPVAKPKTPVKRQTPRPAPSRKGTSHHADVDDSCGHEDDKCTSSVQCCGDGMCHDFDSSGVGKCW